MITLIVSSGEINTNLIPSQSEIHLTSFPIDIHRERESECNATRTLYSSLHHRDEYFEIFIRCLRRTDYSHFFVSAQHQTLQIMSSLPREAARASQFSPSDFRIRADGNCHFP